MKEPTDIHGCTESKARIHGHLHTRPITAMPAAAVTICSIWTKRDASEIPYEYTVVVTPPTEERLDALEAAWTLTNQGHRPHGNCVCSTSAGDLMALDGQWYLVESTGYAPVTADQAAKIKTLTSRDTSWGLEDLVKNQLV